MANLDEEFEQFGARRARVCRVCLLPPDFVAFVDRALHRGAPLSRIAAFLNVKGHKITDDVVKGHRRHAAAPAAREPEFTEDRDRTGG